MTLITSSMNCKLQLVQDIIKSFDILVWKLKLDTLISTLRYSYLYSKNLFKADFSLMKSETEVA